MMTLKDRAMMFDWINWPVINVGLAQLISFLVYPQYDSQTYWSFHVLITVDSKVTSGFNSDDPPVYQ